MSTTIPPGSRPPSAAPAPSPGPAAGTPTGAAPLAQANPEAWGKAAAQKGVVDTTVPAHVPTAEDVAATRPNPVETAIRSNIDRVSQRLETVLGYDALSIAKGRRPLREGDPITNEQISELRTVMTDFLKDTPIGALSPEVVKDIQRKLDQAGLDVRDLNSARLRDLGPIGREIGKELLRDLKADSPTSYYSVIASAAAAIGYVGYQGGSERLQRFGVSPRISKTLFDDSLRLELRGDWEARFKNFTGTAAVTHRYKTENWELSTRLAKPLTGNDPLTAGVRVRYMSPHLDAGGYFNATRMGPLDVGADVTYQPHDRFRLSATIQHNFVLDQTTASAEAWWKLSRQLELGVAASRTSNGDSRVGVGLTYSFD